MLSPLEQTSSTQHTAHSTANPLKAVAVAVDFEAGLECVSIEH